MMRYQQAKTKVRISAILPNYNSIEFLPISLQSLLNQTQAFDEIIIVDDGSTDESIFIINSFMEKHDHIKLIRHEKNEGICNALNTGISISTGDYVMLCAADDSYHERCVELAKDVIAKFPSVGLICGDAIVSRFDVKDSFYRTLNFPPNQIINPKQFKSLTRMGYVGFNGGGGMFMNKMAILSAGKLLPQLKWHSDWMLYFVIAFRSGIFYVNDVFISIDIREQGYSQGLKDKKTQQQVLLETVKAIRQNYPDLWNDFKAAALFPHHAIRYIYLFIFNSTMRSYFSIKLFWKLLINNRVVTRIGRLLPYQIILKIRKILRA